MAVGSSSPSSGPLVALVVSLLLGGCADDAPLGPAPEPPVEVAADGGGPEDLGAQGSPDLGGPPDLGSEPLDVGAPEAGPADAGMDGGEPEPEPPVVRFIAMGDTGEGNQAQYDVSAAVEAVCLVQGCEFVLLLGDNFYDAGVRSVDDPQFRTKFEEPYANLRLPFFVTLGNHDFGEVPVEFWRTEYQVQYTSRSSKWNLPDHFYSFVAGPVTFLSLDTNMIMLGLDWVRDQRAWIRDQIDQAETPWIVGFGHHPYRSNGRHGNAGNYEGAGRLDPTGVVSGRRLASVFEAELCGRIDLFFSGHDHNRQWLEPACGVEHIVSGAGAKTTGLVGRDRNPTRFEDDQTPGFFWIEIEGDQLTVEAWDRSGRLDHRGTVGRRPR